MTTSPRTPAPSRFRISTLRTANVPEPKSLIERSTNVISPTLSLLAVLLLVLSACSTVDTAIEATTTSLSPTVATSAPGPPTTTTVTTPTAQPDDTRLCTLIGCESALTIELSNVDIQPEATYGIDICVDDTCLSETVTIDVAHPGTGEIDLGKTYDLTDGRLPQDPYLLIWTSDEIYFHLGEGEYGTTAGVSLTLTDDTGAVLVAIDGEGVSMERTQPNGPDCLPICFGGRMIV
jgi:hypothetical protein